MNQYCLQVEPSRPTNREFSKGDTAPRLHPEVNVIYVPAVVFIAFPAWHLKYSLTAKTSTGINGMRILIR